MTSIPCRCGSNVPTKLDRGNDARMNEMNLLLHMVKCSNLKPKNHI